MGRVREERMWGREEVPGSALIPGRFDDAPCSQSSGQQARESWRQIDGRI